MGSLQVGWVESLSMEILRKTFSLNWKDSECSLAAHTCDKFVYITENVTKCLIWRGV
jgi:hypothetical protein